ncbi:MAG: MmgE/PrpD family protein [Gammaproteobacteria bacterium]|nr:MmgE/PrpD family protein [Gammaproteobacteria bacterium]
MSAIEKLAELISAAHREHQLDAIAISRNALIDTVACMFAGSTSLVAEKTLQSVTAWGSGDSAVIGQSVKLNPPFAAMVNGASAHAFDYDDFDEVANAHPSAVIFPALLALAAEEPVSGMDILDAHIVGVEIMQRLGEAMNMDHYRRGWLSTLTLGSIGAAAACARLGRFDHATTAAALSLSASMASGLTNQGGFLAKQLHPGLAAKNGVMASALAAAGITASEQTIDGPISLANSMGEHQPHKFAAAMAKLGNPWSIVEYGLITKAYPTCGYTHRVIDAAIEIHSKLKSSTENIRSIQISIPDYYLDLLIYSSPGTAAEAMFSAEYSVATALVHGNFGLPALTNEAIADPEITRLCGLVTVVPRTPRNSNIIYDPLDPDTVEVQFDDGSSSYGETTLLTGSPAKPMSKATLRSKFDECLENHKSLVDCNDLWVLLSHTEQLDKLNSLVDLFSIGVD